MVHVMASVGITQLGLNPQAPRGGVDRKSSVGGAGGDNPRTDRCACGGTWRCLREVRVSGVGFAAPGLLVKREPKFSGPACGVKTFVYPLS
jgi:hypothetical protein